MKRGLTLLTALLTVVICCTAAKTRHDGLWGQRATLFELLPVDSTDIVMLGNSITHYCEWHELLGMDNVKNRGISGDVVGQMTERLDPIVKGHPAKIFVMGGVNDVSHKLSADSIASLMETLLDYIIDKSPQTKIYLQSALPINNDFGRFKSLNGTEQVVVDYNKRLVEIARQRGITFINLFPLFADADGKLDEKYTNDGLHLLGNAYLVWRDAIMPYIKE